MIHASRYSRQWCRGHTLSHLLTPSSHEPMLNLNDVQGCVMTSSFLTKINTQRLNQLDVASVRFLAGRSVHTTHTHTHTKCPINGRVESLNANDSPLILIRETHQIQTMSGVNRQVRAAESHKETTSSLLCWAAPCMLRSDTPNSSRVAPSKHLHARMKISLRQQRGFLQEGL